MKQDVILVLDCGATNVRAMAVDRQGNIIARAATANASDIAAEKSDWHQWSLEAIMQRFADCCRQIHRTSWPPARCAALPSRPLASMARW